MSLKAVDGIIQLLQDCTDSDLEAIRPLVAAVIYDLSVAQCCLQEISQTSHIVLDIVQRLCIRDERFKFIKSALEEFIDASKIKARLESLSSIPKQNHLWGRVDMEREMLVLKDHSQLIESTDALYMAMLLREIIDSTFFELHGKISQLPVRASLYYNYYLYA